jgi:cobalt-precorrin 5A hydrolase
MKHLTLGIGCRRGTPLEQIDAAVRDALDTHSIDEILTVATVDSKADEPGLLAFCARYGLTLQTFSLARIASAPATPTPSAAVRTLTGVDGVCEPCALLAAPAGRLITRKRVHGGVTVAIASVSFDAPVEAAAATPPRHAGHPGETAHAARTLNSSIAQDPQ